MALIEVENVSKSFRARGGPGMLLARGGFANLFRHRRVETITALHDISFTVEPGEAVGIIGANGSGKSTLLKLLAGVSVPTSGRINVYGRVASLLELGAGFHPLLTGRENVYLNARILGVGPAQVNRVFEQIVAFSGIGEFLDNPVNTYSSGMFVRLGFAVAVHTDPDVFLVDEVLSVGDEEFQRKCRTRIGELREQGKTIVFVSHDLGIVNSLCNRVVLLSKGKMIVRESPKATIDFYLRQIGRDIGIHTFGGDSLEAIQCHGRVSVFQDQREISAPSGFQMQIESMGQWHLSSGGDWIVDRREPNRCVAHGRMARLPVTLYWDLRFEGSRLVWNAAMECERDVDMPSIALHCFLPPSFTRWMYNGALGLFPNILPGDLNWTSAVPSDMSCREAAVLPPENSPLRPVLAQLDSPLPYFCLNLSNTDYVTGARALHAQATMPGTAATFAAGRHELLTLTLDFGQTVQSISEWVDERLAMRTIVQGPLKARFDAGRIHISYDGEELTAFLHFYTSMLFGAMWNDSTALHWRSPRRTGQRIEVTGESRRFPYRQTWEIEAAPEGLAVRIILHVDEAMDVDEYHASIVLRPDYSHWETDHESGAYPDFVQGLSDWRHANRIYAPGRKATALSSSLPSVTLMTATDETAFHMTAINTGYHENARVLQALHSPGGGQMHFDKGDRVYFDGIIAVHPNQRATAPNTET